MIKLEPIAKLELEKFFLAKELRRDWHLYTGIGRDVIRWETDENERANRQRDLDEKLAELKKTAQEHDIELRPKAMVNLVFTDGTNILSYASDIRSDESCDALCLIATGGGGGHHEYWIPINNIAGLFEISCELSGKDFDPWYNEHLYKLETVFREFVISHGRYIPPQQQQQQQQLQQCEIHFDEMKFTDYTPFYADWDFLSKREGGITSLGGPIGSVGWKESLWNTMHKQLKEKPKTFEQAAQHRDLVVAGYVNILIGEAVKPLNMEDADWYPFLLTSFRFKPSEVPGEWILAYFKKKSCLIPCEMWEQAAQPLSLFGEFIQQSIRTEFGAAKGFFKLRGAAVLPS